MSIEFGILREGFTATIIGEYRVVLSDSEWFALESLFKRIGELTGQELEWWGDAEFDSKTLPLLVNELEAELKNLKLDVGREVLMELIRVARHALSAEKKVSFLGD